MRRIAGIAVAGILLTGTLTACGKLDGAARSVKDAASEASSSPSATETDDTNPSADPTSSATTRTPSRTPSSTRRPTSASPSRPVTAAEVPNLGVEQLLSLARTAAGEIKTVHVRGTAKLGGTEKAFVDAYVDRRSEDLYGSATFPTYRVDVVRIGPTTWLKWDERYWLSDGSTSAARARELSTKHFRTETTDPAAKGLVDAMLGVSDPEYPLESVSNRSTKLPVQQFESWQVIPIRAANGDTLYLNAGLPVYPIRLITSGIEPEADNYDRFNEPVVVTPPPANLVVDMSDSR